MTCYMSGWATDVGTGGGVHTHQGGRRGELYTGFLSAGMFIEVYSFSYEGVDVQLSPHIKARRGTPQEIAES